MKKLLLTVWFFAFFTLAGQAAFACSCGKITGRIVLNDDAPKPSPEEIQRWRVKQADFAFFIGSVVKIEKVKMRRLAGSHDRSPMKRVTVTVEKYWLGVKTPEMIIYTGVGGGDCGVPYVKGKQYFFAASRDRVTRLLETGICSPSEVTNTLTKDFDEAFGPAKDFAN